MTDKSDDRVGHLNTILARGGQDLPGEWGVLKFRVDWRIRQFKQMYPVESKGFQRNQTKGTFLQNQNFFQISPSSLAPDSDLLILVEINVI